MPGRKHVRGVGPKEQRMYEHIKDSAKKEGRYGQRAEEVAARTVLKHPQGRRPQEGAIASVAPGACWQPSELGAPVGSSANASRPNLWIAKIPNLVNLRPLTLQVHTDMTICCAGVNSVHQSRNRYYPVSFPNSCLRPFG